MAVHERIKQSESWGNYRQELEGFVKNLEDLLESPKVRTAAANRVRFPDPNRAHPPGPGAAGAPDQHSHGPPRSKICQSCGAENVAQASFCHNCGFDLRPVNAQTSSTNVVAAGYVIALLPLLLLPIVFTPAGVGLGIFNMTQGQSGHGVAQIAIACFTGMLGALIGGAGLGI